MFSLTLIEQASRLLHVARRSETCIVTAESCTGGLLSALLTEVPGSSDVFLQGWVTYANKSKENLLNVSHQLIADYGAVSEEVARAMAVGAYDEGKSFFASKKLISAAITGIAGPDGGSEEKPVGTVHIAVKALDGILHTKECFRGGREKVRLQAVECALQMLDKIIYL